MLFWSVAAANTRWCLCHPNALMALPGVGPRIVGFWSDVRQAGVVWCVVWHWFGGVVLGIPHKMVCTGVALKAGHALPTTGLPCTSRQQTTSYHTIIANEYQLWSGAMITLLILEAIVTDGLVATPGWIFTLLVSAACTFTKTSL